ncbi:MAG: HAMP domain-containing protein [Pseudomonadales bacterium]|nr:HAMP domain-containing protein [Pseudomonadales bacterium]
MLNLSTMLQNFSLRKKILLFNSVIMLVTAVGLSALLYGNLSANQAIQSQQVALENQRLLREVKFTFTEVQYWLFDLAVSWQNESETQLEEHAEMLRDLLVELEKTQPQTAQALFPLLEQYIEVNIEAVDSYVDENRVQGNALVARGRAIGQEIIEIIFSAEAPLTSEVYSSADEVINIGEILVKLGVAALIVVLLSNIISALMLAKVVSAPLEYAVDIAKRIAAGDLQTHIKIQGKDESSVLLQSLSSMQNSIRQRIEADEIKSAENLRIRQALDACQTNVLMTDTQANIAYMNQAMNRFINSHAQSFSVAGQELDNGMPMSRLCAEQSDFLNHLSEIQESTSHRVIQQGLTIDWQVTPILNKDQKITDYIFEWTDETERVQTQDEIAGLISAAKQGDFTQTIDLSGKTGFYHSVAEGLNNMVSAVDSSLSEVSAVLSDIAAGDLNQQVDSAYSGKLAELADATNSMVTKLQETIKDISHMVAEVKKGQFDSRVNEQGKQGFYLEIASDLNAQASVIQQGIDDVTGVLRAISDGDLSAQVTGQYEGQLQQLSEYTNTMSGKLKKIVGEVSDLAEHAGKGQFDVRLQTGSLQGFYLTLSENLNHLNASTENALTELMATINAMAKGDLTQTIKGQYEGMFDELKRDTNATIDNLVTVMAEIKQASYQVKSGANAISSSNLDLSRRTEQQAASLEETAASMEQMTSTIIQNTESSKNASQLAINTSNIAEQGGAVVDKAITAMIAISESSNKIADIISVINEIAFQTNLLALNASVEAARAGEQGRGFAVVAGEVRNLAGRSATAAKEIKDLIEDSVKKVEEGKSLVNKSGESLKNIVHAVKEVSELVATIATASEEQSLGITEVNRAVTKMDEMTQQNAALVEEVASGSETMGQQAGELENKVAFFKTDGAAESTMEYRSSPVSSPAVSSPASVVAAPARIPESPPDDAEWAEF